MDLRGTLISTIAGALAGALVGYFTAITAAPAAAAEHFKQNGLETREVRWVDEAGTDRLMVGIPASQVAGLSPYLEEGEAVVAIMDAAGQVEASFIISRRVVERAAGY